MFFFRRMTDASAATQGKSNIVRRLYDWTIHWADTPYAYVALALLAFAESSFFPIPPDVLVIAMTFAAPKKWWKIAGTCMIFSVLGGVAGWLIGYGFWELTQNFFFTYVPGFTPELFAKVSNMYADNAFLAIFGAALTPIPYKIFTIASGVCNISIPVLIVASIFGRGGRFFAVALVIRLLGDKAKVFLDKYFNLLVTLFFILLVAGFVALKYAWPKHHADDSAPPAQVEQVEPSAVPSAAPDAAQ